MDIKNIRVIIPVAICLFVGVLGSFFTYPSIQSWYSTLNKPTFSPPNFIFAPVWTTLYVLMGISVYMVWLKGIKKKAVKLAVGLFALQLFLNFLWSILFFELHSPLLAFVDIILLLLFIVLTMIKFSKLSKTSTILLIPYLLWVSFASVLNLSIVLLN